MIRERCSVSTSDGDGGWGKWDELLGENHSKDGANSWNFKLYHLWSHLWNFSCWLLQNQRGGHVRAVFGIIIDCNYYFHFPDRYFLHSKLWGPLPLEIHQQAHTGSPWSICSRPGLRKYLTLYPLSKMAALFPQRWFAGLEQFPTSP